jgi:hypothetical protein
MEGANLRYRLFTSTMISRMKLALMHSKQEKGRAPVPSGK